MNGLRSQKLTREEALRAATAGGAYLTFEGGGKRTEEPGKLADIVVLSDNIMSINEDCIKYITSDLTIVGGRIVHDALAT
tara:strand:+ start:7035 stop:7274 length:240 start_codon:yes stop_codon:yes gene_type:complete